MSKSKHTPGPWEFLQSTGKLAPLPYKIHVAFGTHPPKKRTTIALCGSSNTLVAKANAARIVACVNACEGISDPSVVPEMLKALKEVASSNADNGYGDVLSRLLARAEGRKE